MSAPSAEPATTRAGLPERFAPHLLDAPGACSTTSRIPGVLLLYGEEHVNLALADELALDGYEVRRASDPAKLRAACDACEVDLVIFGRATRRGAGLDVLRQLRAGALAPEVKPGLRTLWMSPNGELGDVLRGFDAGADDLAGNVLSAEQTNELLVRSRDECRSLIACACVVDVETEPVCVQDRAKRLRHDRVGENAVLGGKAKGRRRVGAMCNRQHLAHSVGGLAASQLLLCFGHRQLHRTRLGRQGVIKCCIVGDRFLWHPPPYC
jgi:CheY-like chemotaxis protein